MRTNDRVCAILFSAVQDGFAFLNVMYGYQSLEAWKRANRAVLLVLKAIGVSSHPRTHALYDQIRRATLSVAANIVEGYALATTALYRKHLRIAFGSAAEAEYLLKVAGELGYPRSFHIPHPTSHAVT